MEFSIGNPVRKPCAGIHCFHQISCPTPQTNTIHPRPQRLQILSCPLSLPYHNFPFFPSSVLTSSNLPPPLRSFLIYRINNHPPKTPQFTTPTTCPQTFSLTPSFHTSTVSTTVATSPANTTTPKLRLSRKMAPKVKSKMPLWMLRAAMARVRACWVRLEESEEGVGDEVEDGCEGEGVIGSP